MLWTLSSTQIFVTSIVSLMTVMVSSDIVWQPYNSADSKDGAAAVQSLNPLDF
jgi:hypothetical protein